MEEAKQSVAYAERIKWYHWHKFSLLPNVRYRPGNKQNTWSLHVRWLLFSAWTMDSPDIGVELGLSDYVLEARVRLPYLITGIFIHLPDFVSHRHRLWRKPKGATWVLPLAILLSSCSTPSPAPLGPTSLRDLGSVNPAAVRAQECKGKYPQPWCESETHE